MPLFLQCKEFSVGQKEMLGGALHSAWVIPYIYREMFQSSLFEAIFGGEALL